jgi:minor curlin subunit
MKKIVFVSFATLSSVAAIAQNTAVINQQGGAQEVAIVQHGAGNTSVISQSSVGSGNRAVISQSGAGNVATVTQGGASDGTAGSQNSVTTSQSGEGETIINQTKDGNTISVYQSGPVSADKKKKAGRRPPKQ